MKAAPAFLALALLAAIACQYDPRTVRMYEGPERPAAEVAVVRIPLAHTKLSPGTAGDVRYRFFLATLDGVPVSPPAAAIEVLPGPRSVEVYWERYENPPPPRNPYERGMENMIWDRTHEGVETLELEAEAGAVHELVVPAEWSGIPLGFRTIRPAPGAPAAVEPAEPKEPGPWDPR